MQPDPPVVHPQEGHRQHQRYCDAHHQTRTYIDVIPTVPKRIARALVKAQGNETDCQHNHNRLDQRTNKLVYRAGHSRGLVLDLDQPKARGERRIDRGGGCLKGLAHRDDVAALGHGDAQAQHLLPLEMHLHAGRVDGSTPNLGNVTQVKLVTRATPDGHGAKLLHRLELPRHADLHHIQRRLHGARALYRVLLPQLGQDLVHVQAELRKSALRNFDVDFFVLHAKQVHLVNVRHTQQLLPNFISGVFDLQLGEPIGLQRINHAIDVTELVIEKGALHARREGVADVAQFFAHHVPKVGHFGGLGGIFDFKENRGLAGLGKTADLVGKRHLLQSALHLVGDLLSHLLRRCPWPIGADHHRPKGKRRIFVLPKLKVGRHAQHQQHEHEVTGQGAVL